MGRASVEESPNGLATAQALLDGRSWGRSAAKSLTDFSQNGQGRLRVEASADESPTVWRRHESEIMGVRY
jgi:hypothetical protein